MSAMINAAILSILRHEHAVVLAETRMTFGEGWLEAKRRCVDDLLSAIGVPAPKPGKRMMAGARKVKTRVEA
jgi:hypothetical protein